MFQQQIGRDFQSRAHLSADRSCELVEAAVRVCRVCKLHVLTGAHDVDLSGAHAVLVGALRLARHVGICLVERVLVRRCLRLDEGRIKRLHHRGHELGLRVAPELEQGLDHLREIAHATVLIRPLRVNHMQHVGKSGVFLICQHAGPRCRRCSDLKWVVAAYMVGHHHAVRVNLHAVVYGVAGFRVLSGGEGYRASGTVPARRCDPVGLNQVYPQGVGEQRGGVVLLDNAYTVTREQPRHERELLEPVEVVHARGVAGSFIAGPEVKLPLGGFLPALCLLCGEAQHFAIDPAFQAQADAYHVCAVGLDRGGGDGGGHV